MTTTFKTADRWLKAIIAAGDRAGDDEDRLIVELRNMLLAEMTECDNLRNMLLAEMTECDNLRAQLQEAKTTLRADSAADPSPMF